MFYERGRRLIISSFGSTVTAPGTREYDESSSSLINPTDAYITRAQTHATRVCPIVMLILITTPLSVSILQYNNIRERVYPSERTPQKPRAPPPRFVETPYVAYSAPGTRRETRSEKNFVVITDECHVKT